MDCYHCLVICDNDYNNQLQKKLNSPMTLIGMYIAFASAGFLVAMGADLFNGFRNRRFWFPSRYFSLNAISLTMLAVMTKLPLDITNDMRGSNDKLAVVSSIAVMSVAIANFMNSLGSMAVGEIGVNLGALGILAVTILVNVGIHIHQMRRLYVMKSIMWEQIVSLFLMMLLLLTSCSLALMVPSAKRYLESEYNEMLKIVSSKPIEWGEYTIDDLKVVVKRYWVMSETGSLLFVMARAAISITVSLICMGLVITLLEAYMRIHLTNDHQHLNFTNYQGTINWILYIQAAGVVFGGVAPLFRWLFAARFKIMELSGKKIRQQLYVETYWTSMLMEWRETSFPMEIHNYKCKKFAHDAKGLVLNICIWLQILFVLVNKVMLITSCKFGSAMLKYFKCLKDLEGGDSSGPNDLGGSESRNEQQNLDFSRYVLLLQGEVGVPKMVLKNICDELDVLIQIGENKRPKHLIDLLVKSRTFNGVVEFDSSEVPSLHLYEPPNCWSLPVVTLTSIAIALPSITHHKCKRLLQGVKEGLSLVELIETTLNRKREPRTIRNAANRVWVGIELYGKWESKSANLKVTTGTELLHKFSEVAKKTVVTFLTNTKDSLMHNPVHWPAKVTAANSMYRISQTMLRAHKDDMRQTNEALFERLSLIISDILAACLTNLVHVINCKCQNNSILERVESVSQAAVILGESREILEILHSRELPNISPQKSSNIDEWRAYMDHSTANSVASAIVSRTSSPIQQLNGDLDV